MNAILSIAKEALELSPCQRLTLARILLDLSEENQEFSPDVEKAWDIEISRRLSAVMSGEAVSSSFEEVFSRLEERFPG